MLAQKRMQNTVEVCRRRMKRTIEDDKNKDIENEDGRKKREGKCVRDRNFEREKNSLRFCYEENKFFSRVLVTASSITLFSFFYRDFFVPPPLFFVIRPSSCLLKFSFFFCLAGWPTISTTCCCSIFPQESDLFCYMLLSFDLMLLYMQCHMI